MQLGNLLDRAKVHTGRDAETAKRLGVSPARLSEWRNGHRPCPLEVQARICEIAELSAGEAWDHVRELAAVPPKKSRVASTAAIVALFAGLLGIGGAPRVAHAGGPDASRDNV